MSFWKWGARGFTWTVVGALVGGCLGILYATWEATRAGEGQ